MKKTNAVLHISFCLMLLVTSARAHAGIPTIDIANLVQSILQVFSWIEQANQMITQIRNMEREIRNAETSIRNASGIRGFGNILNDLRLQGVVSDDMYDLYTLVSADGYDGLSSAARRIRSRNRIYDCGRHSGDYKKACDASLSISAQTMANQENASKLLQDRVDQIQGLQDQINSTTDEKGIAELQARIAAESSHVQNDTNRLSVMNAVGSSAQTAVQQQIKELELKNVTSEENGVDTFEFELAR